VLALCRSQRTNAWVAAVDPGGREIAVARFSPKLVETLERSMRGRE